MTWIKNNNFVTACIIIFSALLFIPFLGGVHLFDWDEINFAESAREMLASNNYLNVQINFHPFWEKPPLFIWMQVLSMKCFGINEFAARFPNAICGMVSLLVIYNIGRKLYDSLFGFLWALAYAGSVLPFFYFKSGIIDPWFNLFIFIGIYFFIEQTCMNEQKSFCLPICLSAFFIGLAILTKGPVALLIFMITVGIYWAFNHSRISINFWQILLFIIVLCLTGGLWFIIQIISGNYQIVVDFINYQVRLFQTKDAGHGGFLLYHFVVLFLGVFPASILAIAPLFKTYSDNSIQREYKKWMVILFWTVLILFTIVKTKIIHYSSLCYYPLSFLAAYLAYKVINREIPIKKWTRILLLIVASLYAFLTIMLPLIKYYLPRIFESNLIKDDFALANLQANAQWKGFESLIGILFLIAFIIFLYQLKKENYFSGFTGLFISTMVFTFMTAIFFTPRIEEYSQKAAIDFYQGVKGKNCYVETLGFKSYANLFYFKKPVPAVPSSDEHEWLLSGKIDKPVYFVTKIDKKDEYLKQYPELKFIYQKNGFVFLIRRPLKNTVN